MKTSVIKRNYEAIRQRTGINFEQYKDESWGETIANLVFFPQYALANVLKGPAILMGSVIVIAIICMFTEHRAFGTFFLLFGLIFGLVNGFYLGCIWFISSFSKDMKGLINITVQKSNEIIQSFRDPSQRQAYKASLVDVVRGVVFSMILPEVNKVIAKKVPVIGGIVAWIAGKAIGKMTSGLENRIMKAGSEQDISDQADPARQQVVLQKVENTSQKVATTTAKVASFPFKILISIFGFIWVGITALLYWMMF